MLKFLIAPAIEYSCQEEDPFVVLERIFEYEIMNFLSRLSYEVAHFQGCIAVASEQEPNVLHDESPHLHSLPLFGVATILSHLLDFAVNRANELENAIGPIVAQIDLERHLIVQIHFVNQMSNLVVLKYQ